MANVLIEETTMSAIGDAIRAKTGKTEGILPADMPSEIEGISGGGGDDTSFKDIIERTSKDPITLPSDLATIGNYAFYNYTNLKISNLPAGVTAIGASAFYGCKNLALTSLPSGVTSISSDTFYNCISLALTSLPSGIKSLGRGAFGDCTGLTSLTFEGTPTTINSYAFSNCTNIATINVPWAEGTVKNAPWGATNATINYNYTGE